MKRVTLEQIGNALGVSKVAIYKALNGKKGVSEELVKKAQEKAKEMGYVHCNTTYKTNLSFAFVIKKDLFLMNSEQFYTSIFYYLTIECGKINSAIETIFIDDSNTYENFFKSITSGNKSFDGIFMAGEASENCLAKLYSINIPIVFIDYYSSYFKFDYIFVDNFNLGYLAGKELIKNGHKNIGFIGDIHSTSSICDRFLGFTKAIIENNLFINNEWYIFKNIEKTSDIEDILPENLPSAFICHCDSAASKLYTLLKIRNFSVPDDVSVISFDNTDICKLLTPPLSSIGVNKDKYAVKSMNSMMNLINKTPHQSRTILSPSFTSRNSIKNLNN